ncbi:MAG TPA: hypothetical protein VFZ86_14655 [Thermoleophilia bacterium]|nr:hypothetical protein [Thermoleophilia bacterium]
MGRPSRLRQPRLLRRDWVGDGILTLLAGAVLVIAVFLPWANEDLLGDVNYSLSSSGDINGVLQTQWGAPALALALTAVALGAAVTLTRPRRLSWLLGLAVAACGAGVFAVAQDAASQIAFFDPGLGLYLTTLVGVLLVPIGAAAAMVAWFVARADAAPLAAADEAPTAPPAPENAPPS